MLGVPRSGKPIRGGLGPPVIVPPTPATPGLVKRGVKMAVIQSVDNAQFPQFATVLIENKIPGEMGYSLPQGVGPFAAGGTSGYNYYYDNASGIGGSICYVDCDNRVVVSFTGGVSSTPPTPFYKALADHLHNGNLNPDGFNNPQPVNLSSGEIQGLLPYGNSPGQMQGVISSTGNIIGTDFPGTLQQITSGQYGGLYQMISSPVRDIQPRYCVQAATYTGCQWLICTWRFMTTYSVAGGNIGGDSTAGYGPAIWDANNNYVWLQFQNSSTGALSLAFDTPPGDGGDPFLNKMHTISLCIQPFSGGNGTGIQWYVDGELMTGNTPTTIPNNFTPPFTFGFSAQGAAYPPTGIYAAGFEAATQQPHAAMPQTYQLNWDHDGNLQTTQGLSGTTQNVTPYVTDFTLHYSINAGATSLTYWFDNGSGADSKIYSTYDKTGASDTSIGHTTAGSPSGTVTGLASGNTVYILAYYSNGAMHFTTKTNTAFAGTDVRNAYADGSVACMASLTTSTSSPSGPISVVANATGTRTGNGGRTLL